ncbi:hypothetical protein B0H17DRAFT_1247004 [Mycena rosella]|uniref:Uncharacterized protein n=1 Tax=Mycena rosella TaxID=1033263 RepID=A0AAD7G9A6_MYCRO|nr:hypothetical protein B0H17DRAFT_1247004 [Mycena rosella]
MLRVRASHKQVYFLDRVGKRGNSNSTIISEASLNLGNNLLAGFLLTPSKLTNAQRSVGSSTRLSAVQRACDVGPFAPLGGIGDRRVVEFPVNIPEGVGKGPEVREDCPRERGAAPAPVDEANRDECRCGGERGEDGALVLVWLEETAYEIGGRPGGLLRPDVGAHECELYEVRRERKKLADMLKQRGELDLVEIVGLEAAERMPHRRQDVHHVCYGGRRERGEADLKIGLDGERWSAWRAAPPGGRANTCSVSRQRREGGVSDEEVGRCLSQLRGEGREVGECGGEGDALRAATGGEVQDEVLECEVPIQECLDVFTPPAMRREQDAECPNDGDWTQTSITEVSTSSTNSFSEEDHIEQQPPSPTALLPTMFNLLRQMGIDPTALLAESVAAAINEKILVTVKVQAPAKKVIGNTLQNSVAVQGRGTLMKASCNCGLQLDKVLAHIILKLIVWNASQKASLTTMTDIGVDAKQILSWDSVELK